MIPGPYEILHHDEQVVVINKPGGVLVHRTSMSSDSIFVLQELGKQIDAHLYPVHRLDRATSGALMFALSSEVARRLQDAIQSESSHKEYLALVRGTAPETGETDRPLTSKKGVKQSARTSWERVAEFSRCSLLRVRIHTGRRHQIRRHFAHLCHQLIGDTNYGKGRINTFFREEYGLPRLFLHASRIDLDHPSGLGRLVLEAPLPTDLREFLLRLPDCDPELVATL